MSSQLCTTSPQPYVAAQLSLAQPNSACLIKSSAVALLLSSMKLLFLVTYYGNMGCQVSKEGIQNNIEFLPNISLLHEHYFIFWVDIVLSHQKLALFYNINSFKIERKNGNKKSATEIILFKTLLAG